MSNLETDPSASLRNLAQTWLKRDLTAAELSELEQFRQSWENPDRTHQRMTGGTASSDPAAHARAQAAQALNEGKQRSESLIRDVLQKLQATASQALQAHEREEQAILKIVETAHSLNDLRPSALMPPAAGLPPAAQLALPQIADRLANLVKTEVERCFERYFGPLQRQLATALERIDRTATLAETTNTTPAPPQTPLAPLTDNSLPAASTSVSQSPSPDVYATSATPAAH
jgi:hypothetical protein